MEILPLSFLDFHTIINFTKLRPSAIHTDHQKVYDLKRKKNCICIYILPGVFNIYTKRVASSKKVNKHPLVINFLLHNFLASLAIPSRRKSPCRIPLNKENEVTNLKSSLFAHVNSTYVSNMYTHGTVNVVESARFRWRTLCISSKPVTRIRQHVSFARV